jgi:hypothetical protein
VTPKFCWRPSAWNGKKKTNIYYFLQISTYSNSLFAQSMPSIFPMILTVLTGVHSIYPSDAQMTRRVARAVLHCKYNAGNYVSGSHNTTGIFFVF